MQLNERKLVNNLHNNNKKTYIIHGIGTDCGKTFATCNIINALNEKSKQNFVIKPIITGFEPENYHASDNFKLLSSAFQTEPSLSQVKSISKYLFPHPLSPDIASWKSTFEIDFESVVLFCKNWQKKAENEEKNLFIETAGGVCSPISNHHTMADLSNALTSGSASENTINILVSTPYLGAISHTISALHMLKFNILIINRSEPDFEKSITNHLPYKLEIYTL